MESEHWTLTPASKWKKGKVQPAVSGKDSDEIQIQALTDASFKKVCVDSGAGESVCPVDAFPSYKTVETAKTGAVYRAAGGQRLKNVGEIRPSFKSSGIGGSMAFQATTDVQKPLAAASKITCLLYTSPSPRDS